MENQFVPYEFAVKLKELGFDEECLAVYKRDGSELATLDYIDYENLKGCSNSCLVGYWYNVSAPLWQQAFDWFREKHERHIETMKDKGGRYYIFDGDNYIREKGRIMFFNTYEQARYACLEKLIELSK
jgi:hypothetical protein